MNRLIVVDFYVANQGRNLRAQRREVAADKGIVRGLFIMPALPAILVAGDRYKDRYGK